MKRKCRNLLVLCLVLLMGMTAYAEGYRMDYETIVSPVYDAVGTFNDGLAAVKKDGLWGYIDEKGNTVIEHRFIYASSFSEGKALVGLQTPELENESAMELGLIDMQGNFRNLIAPAREGGQTVLKVSAYDYMDADYLDREDGGYDILWKNEKEYVYHNGYLVIPNGFDLGADAWQQFLIFDKNGTFVDNKVLIPAGAGGEMKEVYLSGAYSDCVFYTLPEFGEDASKIAFFTENKELVCMFDSWPCEKETGDVLYNVFEFFDGYAGAFGTMMTGNPDRPSIDFFALINKKGEIIFKGEYERFYGYRVAGEHGFRVVNDGRISLKHKDGMWGACDVTGNTSVPFIYEDMQAFREGLCAVKKNGLWGFIDVNNKMVISPQYTRVSHFNGGIALAEKDGVSMVIDRYNNVLDGTDTIPLDFYFSDSIRPVKETIVVEENGRFGFGKITYNMALPAAADMSPWAFSEVSEAISSNLIPMYLQNKYFENIKREDFAQLIVKALEEVTGKDAEALLKERTGLSMQDVYAGNSFKDTSDKNILIANKLGIINGVSEASFAPANQISRQDAAALLMRAAKLLKGDIETVAQSFEDDASIADYARQAVSYVTTLKIMNGVGENQFAPTATYTREQAYITILRLFKALVQ